MNNMIDRRRLGAIVLPLCCGFSEALKFPLHFLLDISFPISHLSRAQQPRGTRGHHKRAMCPFPWPTKGPLLF